MFQSLFWWRGRLDNHRDRPLASVRESFNPCFGGEAVWTLWASMYASFTSCFNPCFGGEAVWTSDAGGRRLQAWRVSILVLVERPFGPFWRTMMWMPSSSFNPCFGGEAVWTAAGFCKDCGALAFQSLFWWRGRLDATCALLCVVHRKFQSLFWWRGRLDT